MVAAGLVQCKIEEFRERGYCVLRDHFAQERVEVCRNAFWPGLRSYLASGVAANRGPNRHFLAMPFDPPCFASQFFFDPDVLGIVRGLMDDRIVADQWGCDVPVSGSEHQNWHVDYQRLLFPELPELSLPPYAVVVSFGLVRIAREHGPIEISAGTHRMKREEALRGVERGELNAEPVLMDLGDVLIRHPWALHRGTPNITDTPRALVTIRYVRHWYADASRDVESIPLAVWSSLAGEQQSLLRFPLA